MYRYDAAIACVPDFSDFNNGEYQLLPRYERDIEKTGEAKVPEVVQQKITAENRLDAVRGYLLATAGALTAVLLGMVVRKSLG